MSRYSVHALRVYPAAYLFARIIGNPTNFPSCCVRSACEKLKVSRVWNQISNIEAELDSADVSARDDRTGFPFCDSLSHGDNRSTERKNSDKFVTAKVTLRAASRCLFFTY